MPDERARLKAAGFSDAEIDAELGGATQPPARPSIGKFAGESTGTRATLKNATPEQVAANQTASWDAAKGLGANAADGATFSLAGRAIPAIRTTAQAYANDHPGAALAAQMAGGVVSGFGLAKAAAKVPALVALGLAPKAEATMTLAQRVGQGAKMGGAAGAITGGANAESLADIPRSAALGAAGGALMGGAFGWGTEAIRGARNLVAGMGSRNTALPSAAGAIGPQQGPTLLRGSQGAARAGPIRRAIQAESPEDAGARRVLARMGRENMTVDDLVTANAGADRDAVLAELLPNRQGVAGLRVARNVGRERDRLDKSLAARTAEMPSRYAETISAVSGVPEGLDAGIVAQRARDVVSPRVEALYRQVYAQPDVSAKRVLPVLEKLNGLKRGREALTRAGELSSGFDALQAIDPANPMISTQNLHYMREGLDYALDNAVKEGDAQMVRILSAERHVLDREFKKQGGKLAQRADRLWERANATGESFASGQKSQTMRTKPAMVKARTEARDPEAFQRGAASKQIEGVDLKADGGAGQTRNPVVETMGSKTARARASLGYKNAGDFRQVRDEAGTLVDQIATQRGVSGNSTTAANLSEMADEFMTDPSALIAAPLNPVGALKLFGERGARAAMQGLNAQQATQMGRILGAGLPGQMSRDEAVAMLQRMEPTIRNQIMRQLAARNAATRGGLAGASTLAR